MIMDTLAGLTTLNTVTRSIALLVALCVSMVVGCGLWPKEHVDDDPILYLVSNLTEKYIAGYGDKGIIDWDFDRYTREKDRSLRDYLMQNGYRLDNDMEFFRGFIAYYGLTETDLWEAFQSVTASKGEYGRRNFLVSYSPPANCFGGLVAASANDCMERIIVGYYAAHQIDRGETESSPDPLGFHDVVITAAMKLAPDKALRIVNGLLQTPESLPSDGIESLRFYTVLLNASAELKKIPSARADFYDGLFKVLRSPVCGMPLRSGVAYVIAHSAPRYEDAVALWTLVRDPAVRIEVRLASLRSLPDCLQGSLGYNVSSIDDIPSPELRDDLNDISRLGLPIKQGSAEELEFLGRLLDWASGPYRRELLDYVLGSVPKIDCGHEEYLPSPVKPLKDMIVQNAQIIRELAMEEAFSEALSELEMRCPSYTSEISAMRSSLQYADRTSQ